MLSVVSMNTEHIKDILNVSFYRFTNLSDLDLQSFKKDVRDKLKSLEIKGTILISKEGINGFLAGTIEKMEEAFQFIESRHINLNKIDYKKSWNDHQPFTRTLVKIKKEIVTMGVPWIAPETSTGSRLTPEELKQWYDEKRDFLIIDTRNDYELKLGTFENAVDMNLKTFRQFPNKVEEFPDEWKDKTIVTFCTGGIRCEKASAFMKAKGFKNIYQLDGGILRYFEKVGSAHYKGDCFVFDHRVALTAELSQSDTALCFICQEPLTKEEQQSEKYVPGKYCPHCYKGKPIPHKEKIAEELKRATATNS